MFFNNISHPLGTHVIPESVTGCVEDEPGVLDACSSLIPTITILLLCLGRDGGGACV